MILKWSGIGLKHDHSLNQWMIFAEDALAQSYDCAQV